jgi:hypothetical protein
MGDPRSAGRRLPSASFTAGGLLASALLVSVGSSALAAECGDRVGGARVACACGDVVISDTTLRPGDPVTATRCPIDGLILRATAGTETLTLDLAGLAIVGRGEGIGVRIDEGGTDGARLVSSAEAPGEIVGFGTGILSPRPLELSRIENLAVKGNHDDGLRLRTAGALIIDVSATDNGGDGIEMAGEGGRLVGVEANGNRRVGLKLRTRGTVVRAKAIANMGHGIVSEGSRNDVTGVEARDNAGVGVVVRGGRQRTLGLISEGNLLGRLRQSSAELVE